ncbi:MAG: DUF1566 domain-containing protein [Campylobacterales bacterium]|nr:DUF1566 domain-containing protein [Campylobacterales bacterium]
MKQWFRGFLVSTFVVLLTACGGGGGGTTASGLKKTGQTTSYYPGDDGDLQKGVDHNYSRDDAKEVVTDHVTGLMWQDDATAASTQLTWQAAIDHCDALDTTANGGYSDWRLPTVGELENIVDYGRSNPAISPLFQNTNPDNYWSSTTYAGDSDVAWYVNFRLGYVNAYYKDSSYYVRCVRAGE